MRAIVSVSDKTGVVDFARGLASLSVEIFSTGGTKQAIESAGVAVSSVSKLTGFPEILDGRVKTLHPAVHGGILARRDNPQHLAQLAEHGIDTIDIVAVNLYPFAQTIARPDATLDDALENIDIGGPTMIRASAKNFPGVVVIVDPRDYALVLEELGAKGQVDIETRKRLAAKAFQHTAAYDTTIASYLRGADDAFPSTLSVALQKIQNLRYGENPHQQAAFYSAGAAIPGSIANAKQLNGKDLSFNNVLDLDAAFRCVRHFASAAVAVIKHGNPCGLAIGDDLLETYERAHAGDPISAFGGVVGINRVVDAAAASEISKTFYEDIIAPGYTDDALAILRKKKDLRVVAIEPPVEGVPVRWTTDLLDFRRVSGGFLVQTPDQFMEDEPALHVVTERKPTLNELADLVFAWRAVAQVKSNAIVLAKDRSLVGVGAGQMSRVDSVEIAVKKAGARAVGSVLGSDAFFPKPDGIEVAAEARVTAIIQPGGSIRDEEIIREANKHRIAMVFTGRRHFRH